MKTSGKSIILMATLVFICIIFASCEKDNESEPVTQAGSTFVSLESPYLICANRNPGGVGFDFEYKGAKGGANNLDSLTVSDFVYDLKIRTIKAEKPDGSLAGSPFIQLSVSVQAVNYSAIDTTCKGLTDFANLNSSNIQAYILQSDNPAFDISTVPTGTTGSPLLQQLMQEYNKLVIGDDWKEAANNEIPEDEPIWIIQTTEGKIVKFIVTDFPANPAPTATGYVAIEWDFIE